MSSTDGSETQTADSGAGPVAEAVPQPRVVTILGLVDIVQALADDSLDNNVYWYDANALRGSRSLGTDKLVSAVRPADSILWFVYGLQVETVVTIAALDGPAAEVAHPQLIQPIPGYFAWTGTVDAGTAPGSYPYEVALQVEGRRMTMASQLTLDVK